MYINCLVNINNVMVMNQLYICIGFNVLDWSFVTQKYYRSYTKQKCTECRIWIRASMVLGNCLQQTYSMLCIPPYNLEFLNNRLQNSRLLFSSKRIQFLNKLNVCFIHTTLANKLQAQPAEFVTQVAEGKLILLIGRANTVFVSSHASH